MDMHDDIRKVINLLGLNLSDDEINKLAQGDTVSLEARSLSEIGSAFIRAESLAAANSENFAAFSASKVPVCIQYQGKKCCINIGLQGISNFITYS